MPKILLLSLSLSVILLTAILILVFNANSPKSVSKSEIDTAVAQAQYIFRQKKSTSEDLSKGPCLSNALLPGWVLDIAHNPRQAVDDQPGNMCPAYLEGRAKHFVELDLDGNLVRAQ